VNLAAHQRALRHLVETGTLPEDARDDPYLREVAESHGLRVVRRIVGHWLSYDVRRSCPLTATALDGEGRLDRVLATLPRDGSSAFVEERRASFLEHVARHEQGLVRSVAEFELALADASAGVRGRRVILWERDPSVILDALAEGRWEPAAAARGAFRTVVSADLPELVAIDGYRASNEGGAPAAPLPHAVGRRASV
jgi:hypothetical protein